MQAAKYCGWNVLISSVRDLTKDAIKVIDEIDTERKTKEYVPATTMNKTNQKNDIFLKNTFIVLKSVDPIKINQASGALYTTWLGISSVLRQEYARVINLSLTLASGIERVSCALLALPLKALVPTDYRKWIPVVIGWISKCIAIKVAWRMQRILTASTSAIAGGTMFARSILRLIRKRRQQKEKKKKGNNTKNKNCKWKRDKTKSNTYCQGQNLDSTFSCNEGDDGYDLWRGGNDYGRKSASASPFSSDDVSENLIGMVVGCVGFYTQIEYQYKNNFSFQIPFPISLVTWPFDFAEKWIQWHITNHK